MSDDLPNPIALLEWLTAFAYEKLDASGDQTIYKSVHHPFLMSAGDMALYWFTFYHAKVAGDLWAVLHSGASVRRFAIAGVGEHRRRRISRAPPLWCRRASGGSPPEDGARFAPRCRVMARIRTIKPEFWGDEKLAPCAPLTRLVFLGLISMADDTGRMVDNVKVIDAFIFPESSETCRGALDELSGMGRIRRGKTTSGQRVIEIVNWSAHQKIDKPNFKASLPQLIDVQEFADFPRDVVDASSNGRGNVVDVSALHTYDLRPTTSIPTTDDPLPIDAKKPRRSAPELRKDDPPKPERKRAAKPTTAPVENWASTFGDWWNANVGAVPYGRVGRDLKPAHALHGIRKLIAGAELYNDPQEGPPRKSFVDFAANCAFWIGLAEMPMFDADGNETIRCKRIPTKARPGAA